jgi:hypothetical protein
MEFAYEDVVNSVLSLYKLAIEGINGQVGVAI